AVDPSSLLGSVGNSAYVEGRWVGDVLVAGELTVYAEYSVPGATRLFLMGDVGEVDSTTGRILVTGVEVDVTSVDATSVRVSDRISVSGTQPLPGGIIIADSLAVADDTSSLKAAEGVDESALSVASD